MTPRDVLTAAANIILFAAVMFLGFCAGAFEPELIAARDALCALLRCP